MALVNSGDDSVDSIEVRTFLKMYMPPLLQLQSRLRTWRAVRHHTFALRAARTLQRAARRFVSRLRVLGASWGWSQACLLQRFFTQRQFALFSQLQFGVRHRVAVGGAPAGSQRDITLQGCAHGLGLSLDARNCVTGLEPGGVAAASGLVEVGDRLLRVDGEALGELEVQQACRRAVGGVAPQRAGCPVSGWTLGGVRVDP